MGPGSPEVSFDFFGKGPHELLANSLVVFVAFIPFFGVKELGRVLGKEKIQELFFQQRTDQDCPLP